MVLNIRLDITLYNFSFILVSINVSKQSFFNYVFEISRCIYWMRFRSSHPEVFLSILKLCSKLTGKHPCRSAISLKLQSNFIEIALQHGCSPVNLLHVFRIVFPKNTSGRLLLEIANLVSISGT